MALEWRVIELLEWRAKEARTRAANAPLCVSMMNNEVCRFDLASCITMITQTSNKMCCKESKVIHLIERVNALQTPAHRQTNHVSSEREA